MQHTDVTAMHIEPNIFVAFNDVIITSPGNASDTYDSVASVKLLLLLAIFLSVRR